MNELRLQYHRDTGIRIDDRIDYISSELREYIEWLEKQIEVTIKREDIITSLKKLTKSDRNI